MERRSLFKFARTGINTFLFSCKPITYKNNFLPLQENFGIKRCKRFVMTTYSEPFPTKEKEAIMKIQKPKSIDSPADQKFLDALAEIDKNNYKFAQGTLTEALILYRDINNKEGELKCLEALGNIQMTFDNFEKVKETFETLESVSRKQNNKEYLLKSLHALGAAYSQLRKLDEAKEKLKEARVLAEQLSDQKTLARVCASLGLIFALENIPEIAIKYLEESLKLAKQSRDIREEGNSSKLLAKQYARIREFDKSNEMFNTSIKMSRNMNDGNTEWECLEGMAKNFTKQGKYLDAIDLHKKALHLGDRLFMQSYKFESGFNLVQAYRLDGDEASALKTGTALLEFAKDWKVKKPIVSTLLLLSELESSLNRFDDAMNRLKEAEQIIQQLSNNYKEYALCLYDMAAIHDKKNELEEATHCLEKSLDYVEKLEEVDKENIQRRVWGLLGDTKRKLQRYDVAINYLSKAAELHSKFKDDVSLLNIYSRIVHCFKKLDKPKDAAIWTAATLDIMNRIKTQGQVKISPELTQIKDLLLQRE